MITELIISTKYLVIFIALIVSALYLLALSEKIRRFIYKQSFSAKEKMVMILFFGIIGTVASEFGFKFLGLVINARDCVAIFAGILGGPAVGIGAGVISGVYRMLGVVWPGFTGTMGSWTAIGCGVATIGAGCVGAYLSKYKNISIRTITPRQIWKITGIAALWEVAHLQVFVSLISPLYTTKTFWGTEELLFKSLLLPMAVANALGILLFLFITRDAVIKREMEMAEKEMKEAGMTETSIGVK